MREKRSASLLRRLRKLRGRRCVVQLTQRRTVCEDYEPRDKTFVYVLFFISRSERERGNVDNIHLTLDKNIYECRVLFCTSMYNIQREKRPIKSLYFFSLSQILFTHKDFPFIQIKLILSDYGVS